MLTYQTDKNMPNMFDGLDSEMRKRSLELERAAAKDLREKERRAAREMDYLQETNEAKREATDERRVTLAWAWAAAEILNMSDLPEAQPKIWTYEKRIGFLGRKAIHPMAAEGWILLDWRNTRYHPSFKHTLILTPRDANNSGIHLSYFSRQKGGNEPAAHLQPEDFHPLSREPLSELDMPWPGMIDPSTMSDHIAEAFNTRHKSPTPTVPWKDERSITFDGFDGEAAWAEYDRRHPNFYADGSVMKSRLSPATPSVEDYAEYKRAKTEETIRRTIAHVAAERLIRNPLEVTREIKDLADDAVEV
jgi:hypothetical protein